jgi:hypothetical protein
MRRFIPPLPPYGLQAWCNYAQRKQSSCRVRKLFIGGFRYAITWVGSVARSRNSCRLHTPNVTFGMLLQSLLPSRGKSVNQCCREMAASPTERSWCVLEFARCIAWTSAMSHMQRTSNAFKVTIKLHTFIFQMVSRICENMVFAKYSDNLYAPCIC